MNRSWSSEDSQRQLNLVILGANGLCDGILADIRVSSPLVAPPSISTGRETISDNFPGTEVINEVILSGIMAVYSTRPFTIAHSISVPGVTPSGTKWATNNTALAGYTYERRGFFLFGALTPILQIRVIKASVNHVISPGSPRNPRY